jgi:hypothetical protein
MKKDNIVVVFSSHLSSEVNDKFIKHISDTIGVKHKVVCYPNFNQYSLPEVYNKAIQEHNAPNTIMVFCHNDITVRTRTWGRLLLHKFNSSDFSIIGLAGTTFLAENGVWWHDRKKMYGVVEHTDGYKTWVSEYAIPRPGFIKPVILVDGVFMAVDCNAIEHQWDEEFKGFHMYDLSFCVPNYLDGCNIGVTTDIRILHQSVGMVNQQWDDNRKQFVEKYKEELPITYSDYEDSDEDILVNVITRTHGRPVFFKNCRESILNQTYKNINHIVGTDIECDYYDAIKLSLKEVQQPRLMPEYNTYPAPWNLHLNDLGGHVKDGWVMYLDDDDIFSHKNALRFIVNNIDDDSQILFWRVKININENGWIVPNNVAFGKKIEAGNFSGIGMMFHSKHLPVDWGSWSYGDFRVVSQLLAKKLKPRWIDLVLTETQGRPNNGQPPIV